MDLTRAVSEPLVKLIAFHNAFNQNVKLTYGAIEQLSASTVADATLGPVTLPIGGEPWGHSRPWRDLNGAVREAAIFVSEMGVARAASAFEHYLIGVAAELDRAAARENLSPRKKALDRNRQQKSCGNDEGGQGAVSLKRLLDRLEVDPESIALDITMVDFF